MKNIFVESKEIDKNNKFFKFYKTMLPLYIASLVFLCFMIYFILDMKEEGYFLGLLAGLNAAVQFYVLISIPSFIYYFIRRKTSRFGEFATAFSISEFLI
ncbi:hypothetical protein [Virgibacillus sp. L01]|uniref:hypothetical protein n=1 Tax=Virgibacillus sp. L01 TaxID=3457429 RepID=UPI003FD651F0